jgi:TRAP-type transport system small permease protein
MRFFDRLLKAITIFFEATTQILIAVMVCVMTWLVISRQVLSQASSWAEELSLVMLIWFGLIGATFGVRDRYHLRVDIIFKMFPKRVRHAIAYFTDGLIVTFGILLIAGGMQHVMLTMGSTLPATKLPGALRYMPLPLMGTLIVLYGIWNLLGGRPSADADTAGMELAEIESLEAQLKE